MVKLFSTGTSVSKLREVVRNRIVGIVIDELSPEPGHRLDILDSTVTPLLRALEKAKRGAAWDFSDLLALAQSAILSEDAVMPRIELSKPLRLELLDIVAKQDFRRLSLLNREMGLEEQKTEEVGNRGTDVAAVAGRRFGFPGDDGINFN